MAIERTRPTSSGASFTARLASPRTLAIIAVPLLALGLVSVARAALAPAPPAGIAAALPPAELTEIAADTLTQATAKGGTGYTFEIVQHATIAARAGGTPVEIGDPTDPARTVLVPSVAGGTYLERGFASPAGFYAEIRRGPDDPLAEPAWDKVPMELAALVRDGLTWRNDGAGWYVTDRPPGLGLDPTSAALLPTLLRTLAQVGDASARVLPPVGPGRALADPFAGLSPARRLDGTTTVGAAPGIIAVDLADATELLGPADLAFDAAGRLVGLRVLARNTHLDAHDLLIETVITLAYPATPPELPRPDPRYVEPSPQVGS